MAFAFYVKRAYPLWSADLVAGQAQEVDPELSDVDVDCAHRLNCVGVDVDPLAQGAGLTMDSRGYVRHGLYCPDFIVRQHHADQDGPVGHGFRDVLGFDQAEFVDGQVGTSNPNCSS